MKDEITLVLAIWGSVISSILFVLKIIEVKKDQAVIWIRAVFGSMQAGGETVSRGFSFRIVNNGRRVAYLREIRVKMRYPTDIKIKGEKGISLRNDKFWLHDVFTGPPIKIEEGQQQHFSVWITLSDKRCYEGAIAEVVTTTGRRFKSKVIDLFENDNLGHDTYV